MDIPKITPPFVERVNGPIKSGGIQIFQLNIGYKCNLTCRHCHVRATAQKTEMMSQETMEQCLEVLRNHAIPVVDITGGSPELHPRFPWLLQECAALNRRVLVRSNGVILLEKEHEATVDLYSSTQAEVVLSLPHLDPRMTDRQRGEHVFAGLIEVMRRLNHRGYGEDGSGLVLDLVHNPAGAYLPGSQLALESQYRRTLRDRYGVVFNHFFSITNMPIGRYLDYLLQTDNYVEYMNSLVKAFNPSTLDGLMCKSTLSVAWDGTLYDCDFNQMLGLVVNHGAPNHIADFSMARLVSREIVVGDHCYGCTAGLGSSCQGQTIAEHGEK